MDDPSEIPLARFAAFVRQHTHDVRNALNSIELETALLRELAADSEAQASIESIRRQVRAFGGQMRSLSLLLQDPQPIPAPIAASELFLIWKEQHAALNPPLEMSWEHSLGTEEVNVDSSMMTAVFRELLTNAAAFSGGGTITAAARKEGADVIYELCEPKAGSLDLSHWGEPLMTTRRGRYGLGLWSVQRLLAANNARISRHHEQDENRLVTRIFLQACA